MALIDRPSRAKGRIGKPRALAVSALALAAAGVLAACGGASSSSAPATTTTSSGGGQSLVVNVKQYLTFDAATKSATLTLNAGEGTANNGFNFDGFANGQLAVSVPTGWKVMVNCKNESSSLPHTCSIVKSGATTPAFPGAATADPTTGLTPGQSASFTFTAGAPGTYRITCLVPGHEPAGMWDTFTVTGAGAPSISTTGGTTGRTTGY